MKVDNNIFVRGMTGQVGDQFVVRKGKGGQTIIANKPSFAANRVFQPSQLAHQDAFREAIAYAKTAKNDPIYIAKAEGTTMSPFNVAVADWFKKPVVHEIVPNGWTGEIGQTIRVKAQDEIHVAKVRVAIHDENGILEQGDAVRADGLWWTYTTTTAITIQPQTRIVATAQDLALNTAELVWQD